MVVLGTDHHGRAGSITLTRQHYATPWGTLPTDTELVDALARGIGEEEAFREELHHAHEHSVELALVWLHYALRAIGGAVPQVLPVLCGPVGPLVSCAEDPEAGARTDRFIEAMRWALRHRRALVVAAGDLAHVGPAFGDPLPLGAPDRTRLRDEDATSLDALSRGDAAGFFDDIRRQGDARRVCGLAPIHLAARLLGDGVVGEVVDYAQCPADVDGGSLVSIAGLVWRAGRPTGRDEGPA